MTKLFTGTQWFSLPLALRRRWWRETDYGKDPPSAELVEMIKATLESLEK